MFDHERTCRGEYRRCAPVRHLSDDLRLYRHHTGHSLARLTVRHEGTFAEMILTAGLQLTPPVRSQAAVTCRCLRRQARQSYAIRPRPSDSPDPRDPSLRLSPHRRGYQTICRFIRPIEQAPAARRKARTELDHASWLSTGTAGGCPLSPVSIGNSTHRPPSGIFGFNTDVSGRDRCYANSR